MLPRSRTPLSGSMPRLALFAMIFILVLWFYSWSYKEVEDRPICAMETRYLVDSPLRQSTAVEDGLMCLLPGNIWVMDSNYQLPSEVRVKLEHKLLRISPSERMEAKRPFCLEDVEIIPGWTVFMDNIFVQHGNLYHFAELLVPLYRRWNESNVSAEELVTIPKLATPLLPQLQLQSKPLNLLHFSKSPEFNSAGASLFASLSAREHDLQWIHGENLTDSLSYEPGRPVCFEQMIIPAAVSRSDWFASPAQWEEFRAITDRRCGQNTKPTTGSGDGPRRLGIFQRDRSRKILHIERLQEALAAALGPSWTIEIIVYQRFTDECELVKVFSSLDFLISSHGFQEIYALFLREHVPLLEIAPFLYAKNGYQLLCENTGRPFHRLPGKPVGWSVWFISLFISEDTCQQFYSCRDFARSHDIEVDEAQVIDWTRALLAISNNHRRKSIDSPL